MLDRHFLNDDIDTKYESIAEHPELEFPDLVTPYSAGGRWYQGQLCALVRMKNSTGHNVGLHLLSCCVALLLQRCFECVLELHLWLSW